jgi:hypothetical protein
MLQGVLSDTNISIWGSAHRGVVTTSRVVIGRGAGAWWRSRDVITLLGHVTSLRLLIGRRPWALVGDRGKGRAPLHGGGDPDEGKGVLARPQPAGVDCYGGRGRGWLVAGVSSAPLPLSLLRGGYFEG